MPCRILVLLLTGKPKGGNHTDKVVIILKLNGTNDMHRPELPDNVKLTRKVLSCDKYGPFWISWSKKMIKMGTGYMVGTDSLMRAAFKRPDNRRFDV
ncbi:unnamed protein product [Owenia fusiformis]|uniref:Uncharacterized protein n=1 Tax=Owenia fusiformis TaxID=6347 RepID=A0A8S4NEL1_OWEFU|nr:unnamed protein product [Owenia fusiformis]